MPISKRKGDVMSYGSQRAVLRNLGCINGLVNFDKANNS